MHTHVAKAGASTFDMDLLPLDMSTPHLMSRSTSHLLGGPNPTSTLPEIVTDPFGPLEVGEIWTSTTGLGHVGSVNVGGQLAQLSRCRYWARIAIGAL